MNCGSRLQEAGHQVTFLLPTKSLIVDDCKAIAGAIVETYDEDKIAEACDDFREQFTKLLTPAHGAAHHRDGHLQPLSDRRPCRPQYA